MVESHPHPQRSLVTGTWSSILILSGLILIGMAVGGIVGAALLSLTGGDSNIFFQLSDPNQQLEYNPKAWMSIIILQASSHLFTFLIPSLLYWVWAERKKLSEFCLQSRESYRDVLPIFLLTVVLMPFTALVAEWNESMKLPKALAGLESWMKENETMLGQLTDFLMSFKTPGELIIAVIVIAVIPAIGEEVLFRGILQRKLAEHWANIHVAIWVTAAIFSAIHFQFYGFIPRLILGAMFGYLYFWTGRLSMAIFAHFVNNGVTVILLWMHKQGMIGFDIDSADAVPLWAAILSLAVSAILLRRIHRHSPEPQPLK